MFGCLVLVVLCGLNECLLVVVVVGVFFGWVGLLFVGGVVGCIVLWVMRLLEWIGV